MKKYTTYDIKEISDFIDVPEEKLKDCLQDFYRWIDNARAVKNAEQKVIKPVLNLFRWHDDGEHNVNVVFHEVTPEE